jgi:hypothetical protein
MSIQGREIRRSNGEITLRKMTGRARAAVAAEGLGVEDLKALVDEEGLGGR